MESFLFLAASIIGPIRIAEPGLTAGRWQVADKIQVNLEIFNNHCTLKDSTFCFV